MTMVEAGRGSFNHLNRHIVVNALNCDIVSRQRDQRDHNLLGWHNRSTPKSRRACHYAPSRLVPKMCDMRVSVRYVL